MNVCRLKECLVPMRSRQSTIRHWDNKSPSDWSPLSHPIFTLKVERNYNNYPRITPFMTRRKFRPNYDGTPFLYKASALTFQIQHFIRVGN